MFLLQVHDKIVFRPQLQVEKKKTNVGHSYILCQHLNYKCYVVNMTTNIVPYYRDYQSHQSHNDENMFLVFERP